MPPEIIPKETFRTPDTTARTGTTPIRKSLTLSNLAGRSSSDRRVTPSTLGADPCEFHGRVKSVSKV